VTLWRTARAEYGIAAASPTWERPQALCAAAHLPQSRKFEQRAPSSIYQIKYLNPLEPLKTVTCESVSKIYSRVAEIAVLKINRGKYNFDRLEPSSTVITTSPFEAFKRSSSTSYFDHKAQQLVQRLHFRP